MSSTSKKNLPLLVVAAAAIAGAAWLFFKRDDKPGSGQPTDTRSSGEAVFQPSDLASIIDPRSDGWDSEVFAEAAQSQLDRLELILSGELAAGEIAQIAAQEIELTNLLPATLATAVRESCDRGHDQIGGAAE